MKAVFLDRDGTINKEVNLLQKISQLKLIPGSAEAIRKLKNAKFLIFIISNQAVVARGLITEEKINEINNALIKMLEKKGAQVDGIYSCPHHPNADLLEYRKDCVDRKPNTGMIKKVLKKYPISLEKSFFVGDMTVDIQTGKNAGMKTILVKTGFAGSDKKYNVKPDFIAKDLKKATEIILKY